MTEPALELEFLWLMNKEESSEVYKILESRLGDTSLKCIGPLLKLKRNLRSFCGMPILIKDCKRRAEFADSNNQENEKKNKSDNTFFHLNFLFNVFCQTELCKKNLEESFRRFVDLFCCSKYESLNSELYLKFSSIPFTIDNILSTENRAVDVLKFSLGNMIGLNTFYEHFDSKTSIESDNYKITQVKLLLLHDYKKLILYFLVGKNCSIKKRNITTHNWFKLELQYASLYSIVISKTDGLNLYIRMLIPPLMYSMIRKEDEEDYVPFYEIDHTTSWFRTVDLYENCPSYLKKEFSMNTVLKLDFKSENYDFLFQLLTYCKSIQIFFAPVSVIKGELPTTVVQFQLNDFECFYALQCILTGSFEVSDQLIFWKEVEKVKTFLQEKCKENPHALSRSLYQIFEAVTKGNVVNFYDSLKYLYESFWKQEPRTVIDDFSSKKVQDSHLLLIKRCIVTPIHTVFLPPQPTLKSRALRDCEPGYSLRVSIKDVNMDSINYSTKSFGQNSAELQSNFFKKYYKNVLLRGLKIGKRNYKYVGSSTSQLKGHGLWYYAEDSKKKTADDLRREFGALDKIRQVPKYMARMGQTFSQSLGFIEVPQPLTNVKEPDDDIEGGVKEYLTFEELKPKSPKKFLKVEGDSSTDEEEGEPTEPYNFSDGIGRISSELAEEVYKKLDVLDKKPSAMQIRYAGCKGMLVVDPRLKGKTIRFRKSMKKFESDHNSLEILKFSEKRACFLNRPFITILEQLGVSKEVFLKLQKEMIQKHISSMFHEWEACHFLHRHALLRFDFLRMHTAGIHFTEDPLYRSMIYSLFQKQLELLKNKANIEIPADKGRNMFGVVDDTFTLEYGEVFVQYSDWDSDVPIIVKGTVVVTKNPCMHPGDVRKFKAVNVEALHHIVDCIVFPAKGPRPHPDEMAGSDLDGDEYHVMWCEELIFDRDNYPPMAFALSSKDKPKELDRPVMFVIIYFFVTYYAAFRLPIPAIPKLFTAILEEVCRGVKSNTKAHPKETSTHTWRWRHHRSSQFRNGTGGEGNILQPPALVGSTATTHKPFRPTDLTSTSVCTRRVFGGIEPRPSDLESDALTTRLPTTLPLFYRA
ncbi:RNA-dependent RNA polymerase 1 [Trichonephila clavipes]|nr:RNA-dependent RNA polymerase 1 [Trichonephila clavipes]